MMYNEICAQYIRARSFGDKDAVVFIENLANEGDMIAQSFLMVMHKRGFGCLVNQRKASELAVQCLPFLAEIVLSESPETHPTFPHSAYIYAMCLFWGLGIKRDYRLHNSLLSMICSKAEDYVLGMIGYGFCLDMGIRIKKDQKAAFRWYKKAADLNFTPAQLNVALCYQYAVGVPADAIESSRYFRLAAKNNDLHAQSALATLYLHGINNIEQNHDEALRLYQLAADKGFGEARVSLVRCLLQTHATQKLAIEKLHEAAEDNVAEAQVMLSRMYEEGGFGIVRDATKALYWLNRSVEEGYHEGLYRLAICYYVGRLVEKVDYLEAIRLLRLVVEDEYCDSFANACGMLGKCYLNGIEGILDANLEEGVSWYWYEICSLEEDEVEGVADSIALNDENLLYATCFVNHKEFMYKVWQWDQENAVALYQIFDNQAATNLVQLLGERGENLLSVAQSFHIIPLLTEHEAFYEKEDAGLVDIKVMLGELIAESKDATILLQVIRTMFEEGLFSMTRKELEQFTTLEEWMGVELTDLMTEDAKLIFEDVHLAFRESSWV